MREFAFKTVPRAYQAAHFEQHRDHERHILLWEPGVGKSKPICDTAAWLWVRDRIDAVLVLAPNGVHFNWVDSELPKHMPVPYRAHPFDNRKDTAGVQRHERQYAWAMEHNPDHLSVLTVSYDALLKPSIVSVGKKIGRDGRYPAVGKLADFVQGRRVLIVGDELCSIKAPDGKKSKAARALAAFCKWRRGAEGAPVDNSPLDLYAQFMFIDERLWDRHGMGSYTAFENRYAIKSSIPITIYAKDKGGEYKLDSDGQRVAKMQYDPEQGKMVPAHPTKITGYKNLNELHTIIESCSSRLTKEGAGLDLPEKVYIDQPFELTRLQQAQYDKMKDEYAIEVNGELVVANLAMVRLLRLQQITCGYIPVGPDPENPELAEIDPGRNPRLDALVSLCGTKTTQGMIWATFRPDRDKIIDALGKSVICFNSDDSPQRKREVVASFMAGNHQYILGHVASGLSKGHTLVNADHAIFYANAWRHNPRMQAEDRIHRIGQDRGVTYYDIIARGTVDRKVRDALISKVEVAAETLHDKLREWLK